MGQLKKKIEKKNRGSKYLAGLVGKYSLDEVNAINGDRISPDCVCCVTHSLTH